MESRSTRLSKPATIPIPLLCPGIAVGKLKLLFGDQYNNLELRSKPEFVKELSKNGIAYRLFQWCPDTQPLPVIVHSMQKGEDLACGYLQALEEAPPEKDVNEFASKLEQLRYIPSQESAKSKKSARGKPPKPIEARSQPQEASETLQPKKPTRSRSPQVAQRTGDAPANNGCCELYKELPSFVQSVLHPEDGFDLAKFVGIWDQVWKQRSELRMPLERLLKQGCPSQCRDLESIKRLVNICRSSAERLPLQKAKALRSVEQPSEPQLPAKLRAKRKQVQTEMPAKRVKRPTVTETPPLELVQETTMPKKAASQQKETAPLEPVQANSKPKKAAPQQKETAPLEPVQANSKPKKAAPRRKAAQPAVEPVSVKMPDILSDLIKECTSEPEQLPILKLTNVPITVPGNALFEF